VKGATPAIESLLLDEHQGAAFYGVSFWTFRENPRRRLRRKLVDRRDVEQFIAKHKQGGGR